MTSPTFAELESFLAIARIGSFRGAARYLSVSRSALSHSIATLERRLGVSLLNRTTRSVHLTDAGRELIDGISPAISEIKATIAGLAERRASPAGRLRITTFGVAARQILRPLVLDYLVRYPSVQLEMESEGRIVDIVEAGFDAGIRVAEYVPKDMIALPLGLPLRFAVVGSPAYLQCHTLPVEPEYLAQHRLIALRLPSGTMLRWKFSRDVVFEPMAGQTSLIVSDPILAVQAAKENLGLAFVLENDILAELRAGTLVRILEDWTLPFSDLCLYYPGRRHISPNLRALIDLAKERRAADTRSVLPKRTTRARQ